MPSGDWLSTVHTRSQKILDVKDPDSRAAGGFCTASISGTFNEKPHAVAASAYLEASRPHLLRGISSPGHATLSLIAFLLPLPPDYGQASTSTHRWQSCLKPIHHDIGAYFYTTKKHEPANHSPGALGSRQISSTPTPVSPCSQSAKRLGGNRHPHLTGLPHEAFTASRERFLTMHLIDFPSMTHIHR